MIVKVSQATQMHCPAAIAAGRVAKCRGDACMGWRSAAEKGKGYCGMASVPPAEHGQATIALFTAPEFIGQLKKAVGL